MPNLSPNAVLAWFVLVGMAILLLVLLVKAAS
jgi:hypothetical protein